MKTKVILMLGLVMVIGCLRMPSPEDEQIALGREIFFNETFNGNGRTCGSCHGAEDNLTIDPISIANLPRSNALFVAEFNPDLSKNFENPKLMREHALILENLDGFDDLEKRVTQRGVPHTLGLSQSVDSRDGPRTGWSGDGAPGDGSLRAFATGAVIQHFTKTTNRIADVDFRLPTDEELDALEAFQLSLGRQAELELPLALKSSKALRGQTIFNDPTTGKCFACHNNAGANANPGIFGEGAGNLNFNTGVEDLPDQPSDLTGELVPPDDGFGTPGDSTFNTPSLVEAADTGPFFHNNSINTLEGSIAFYNGTAFNNSPAGQLVQGATGSGINLEATQVEAIAAFLRVINTLENIRQSKELLDSYIRRTFLGNVAFEDLTKVAEAEIEDAVTVLTEGTIHPIAVIDLKNALVHVRKANESSAPKKELIEEALVALGQAEKRLIEK
ncbi:MAG: hypothetical protein ACR2MT_16880 [Aurantibacter sp.]